MQRRVILIEPEDNVVTALDNLSSGEMLALDRDGEQLRLTVAEEVSFGHKIALEDIPAGGEIIKYGHTIALSSRDIRSGEHVHVHNAEGRRGRGDLTRERRRKDE